MPPLVSEAEMDTTSSGGEYDAEPMSTNILEDIRDVSKFHLRVNSIEAR